MLDSAIQVFLDERKEIWLKSKIKGKTTDEEKIVLERQATEEFSLPSWLPRAAKRAKQLSLVSHPGKFSHPSAKTTSIIAVSQHIADGFLRSGNVDVDLDVLGNAAALDVYKFLSLKVGDGRTILVHLEEKSEFIKEQLNTPSVSFLKIEQGLMSIKQDTDTSPKTSGRVKQVYFPVVGKGYHLLSVLTPSSLLYKLKKRINNMRFSEEAKEVRGARNSDTYHEKELSEIYGLSVIGFGGTKPQNISVINSQNGGAAYLLSSMPPELTPQAIQPPSINFFTQSLWAKAFIDDFQRFHNQLISDTNNVHVRRKINRSIKNIIYQVADRVWVLRSLEAGWSDFEKYKRLPQYQKLWIDQLYAENRREDMQWFDKVKKELSLWFFEIYLELMGGNAISMGDDQLQHIKKIIDECEEALW
ncbi:MAG: type I-F CRISPR-associated protein Csy1 [Desulfocapsa sp.]|uniref:Type I-F CRISPR-associated protein Csy1 n=1 Tax=Desulfotalea psychrophila TaxID=84980 RepID=A0ABS3AVP5_9BACT|nr:type I-F CRISPR-associated protein Csy1 [Desulfocapsa sp.]MBN4068595.1 type I-F CRISPR-associated protein Csy1 [Desulfotalea psychrophila]